MNEEYIKQKDEIRLNPLSKREVTGVVLAGGKSSRFGSNKALYHLRDKSFLERAVYLLQLLCEEILISGNPNEYNTLTKMNILKDSYENCGPLGGIHAGLQAARTPYVLFLTCDMPLMRPEPLQQMLAEATGADVVSWNQTKAGGIFPLLVSVKLLPEIESALKQGDYKIKRTLCEREKVRMLDIPDHWAKLFININQKEDLEHIIEKE